MKRRIAFLLLLVCLLALPIRADTIRWVDFDADYDSLRYAMEQDIATFEQEKHISWIDILALAACRTGGKCGLASVKKATEDLKSDRSPQEILGENAKYFNYYHEAYDAALGGLLGSYAIQVEGEWKPAYGLKAFSPVAAGYGYSHFEDFGVSRSYGFARRHLGNDLMGGLGTPIVAVEGGVVEVMGWNQYGGWRIGIRSGNGRRYYYYAHLRQNRPFAEGLQEGQTVQAGQVIGYVGHTGYSTEENVNNIQISHLHLGLELIFDESQKESDNEIWVNLYPLTQLLSRHAGETVRNSETKEYTRKYGFSED